MQAFYEFYRAHSELFYNTQLVLAMLGMGATTTVQQFRDVFRRPGDVGLVLLMQFVALPLLAVAFARATGLPPQVAVGMVLLMALPSGTHSNIITFLGRGNVPLSVTATCASTVACLVATPLVVQVFAAQQLPADFRMPLDRTVLSIMLVLLLPLAIGMLVGRYWPATRTGLSKLALWGSMLAVACIWVGAIGGGQIKILEYGWRVPLWIIVFVVLSLYIAYGLTLLMRYAQADAFTLGIEVAMRNGNLGVALCYLLFGPLTAENLLHQGSLYACLFGAGAMLVVGLVAVARRQLRFARQRRTGFPEV